jgi:hypothetical protein
MPGLEEGLRYEGMFMLVEVVTSGIVFWRSEGDDSSDWL